jgi:hypothetical protein
MLMKMEDRGFVSSFQVRNGVSNSLMVSHLLFVDDNMLLCDANMEQHLYIISIAILFIFLISNGYFIKKDILVYIKHEH